MPSNENLGWILTAAAFVAVGVARYHGIVIDLDGGGQLMALPPLIVPLAMGGAMAAGGTGLAIKAAKVKNTRPDGTLIGGSVEGAQGIQDRNAAGLNAGGAAQDRGEFALHNARGAADGNASRFESDNNLAGHRPGTGVRANLQNALTGGGGAYSRLLGQESNAAQLGQQVGQQQREAGQRAALGLAASRRGGNMAAGLRNAFSAQSASNAQAEQAAQITAGQQQLAVDGQQLQAQGQQDALRMQQAGLNMGLIDRANALNSEAVGVNMGVGSQLLGAGLSREGNFLSAQTGNEGLQAGLDQQTELARAEANRKWREQLFATGGSLIGAGGSTMAGAAGGGGK